MPVKHPVTILLFLLWVLKSFGQDKDAFYKRALEYVEKKDYVQALITINSAVKIDPDNLDYLLIKGNALFELGRYQQSYDVYSRMIALNPANVAAYNQRALLHLAIREYDVAVTDFSKALEVATTDSFRLSAYLNRAVVYSHIRKFDLAYTDLRNAYTIDSNEVSVLNNLATICDELGRVDETFIYLRRVIQIDSTFLGGYANLGFAFSLRKNCDSALKYFDKALVLSPEEPYVFNNRAYCHYLLGNYTQAMADVNWSIRKMPGNSYAFRNRALIYLALNDKINACNDLGEAQRLGFTMSYGNEVDSLAKIHCKVMAFLPNASATKPGDPAKADPSVGWREGRAVPSRRGEHR